MALVCKGGICAPLNIISVANGVIPSCFDGVCPRCACFKVFHNGCCRTNSVDAFHIFKCIFGNNFYVIFPSGIKIRKSEIACFACAFKFACAVCNIVNIIFRCAANIRPIKPKRSAAVPSAGYGKFARCHKPFNLSRLAEIAVNTAFLKIFPGTHTHIIFVCRIVCGYVVFGVVCSAYPSIVCFALVCKCGVCAPLNVISVANGVIPSCFD